MSDTIAPTKTRIDTSRVLVETTIVTEGTGGMKKRGRGDRMIDIALLGRGTETVRKVGLVEEPTMSTTRQ
jgi:hypothetical protein